VLAFGTKPWEYERCNCRRKESSMFARLRAYFTYANVMASIAVFIALGGVAWAAANINSGDVVNNSLKSVDLKDGKGVKAADLTPSASGPTAYARVTGSSGSNTVDETISKGIADANVVRQAAGIYCINGLSFEPRHLQATMEYAANGAAPVEAFVTTAATGDCPGEEQAMVYVDADGNPGTFAGIDTAFYLTLWK
jgi:hypothetical protein